MSSFEIFVLSALFFVLIAYVTYCFIMVRRQTKETSMKLEKNQILLDKILKSQQDLLSDLAERPESCPELPNKDTEDFFEFLDEDTENPPF